MKEQKLAVALRYAQSMPAPRITAAGRGAVANRIVELANEHGVPVVIEPGLAKLLVKQPVDAEIPEELYGAVAAILAYLYRLEQEVKRVT